jgi:hypothetical protein
VSAQNEVRTAVIINQVISLREELEKIHCAANKLKVPGRHAHSLFSLKVHINLVRARLAARLLELSEETRAAD